jgi:hypothetical protein
MVPLAHKLYKEPSLMFGVELGKRCVSLGVRHTSALLYKHCAGGVSPTFSFSQWQNSALRAKKSSSVIVGTPRGGWASCLWCFDFLYFLCLRVDSARDKHSPHVVDQKNFIRFQDRSCRSPSSLLEELGSDRSCLPIV